jgi:phosphotransferase system HPr (HPr) family protein
LSNILEISKAVTLVNALGLHARAAAKVMQTAAKFNAATRVTFQNQTASATSILDMMLLTAGYGQTIMITATGLEAEIAMAAIISLIKNGFNEEAKNNSSD